MEGNIQGDRGEKVVTRVKSALFLHLGCKLGRGGYEFGGEISDQTKASVRQNFLAY